MGKRKRDAGKQNGVEGKDIEKVAWHPEFVGMGPRKLESHPVRGPPHLLTFGRLLK